MDTAIIKSIELSTINIPLKEPFIISLGPLYEAQSVIVKIATENGIVGFGECSPFLTINGETTETGLAVGKLLASALQYKNALDIGDCIQLMDTIIYGNNSIKSAFDIALHDIAAQYYQQPLYKYLGGEINKTIYTDYTVSLNTPDAMAKQAHQIQSEGYTVIKVKIGGHGPTDVYRIKAIRDATGYSIPLRIDANQGWLLEEAIDTLLALAPFNIQHAEEPIPRWQFMDLPKIRQASPIPVMSDESCCDIHDLERLIKLKACDKINIKLGKCGGIYKAMQMLQLAEECNIPVQLGAFLESRLAMTAFVHLAYCSPTIQYYDFDTALMFSSDPVKGGITYHDLGRIELPDSIGLGATIDANFL